MEVCPLKVNLLVARLSIPPHASELSLVKTLMKSFGL
jgi:hypothetical protein